MGLFSTVKSFIGNSADHYSNAHYHAQNAVNHAKATGKIVRDTTSSFATVNTLYGLGASYLSFEHVSGKIIAANSAFQFANFFAGGELSTAANLTQTAAMTLVTDPVSCMLGYMGTSILAANPTATYQAIRKLGEAAYEFTGATLNGGAAVAEFGLGMLSDTLDLASQAEDHAIKTFETFDDPSAAMMDLVGKASGFIFHHDA